MCTYGNPEECVWIRFEKMIFSYVCTIVEVEVYIYSETACLQLESNGVIRYKTLHVSHCDSTCSHEACTEAV